MPVKVSRKTPVEVEEEKVETTHEGTVGPIAVPDVQTSVKRGPRKGYEGPRLMWGMVVGGRANALDIALVEAARKVSKAYNGRATLIDVLRELKSHPDFANTKHPDGMPLSDLLTITNVRNRWAHLRDRFVTQMAQKSQTEGGLGLSGDFEITKEQYHAMEAQISKPKAEGGRDFPRLVIMRGAKGEKGISLDDI